MTLIRSLFAGLMILVVGACAGIGGDGKVPLGPLGQQIAEAVVSVNPENRDLRVCWLASGAVEVITDLAQRSGRVEAQKALGHVMMLQGAIDNARNTSTYWTESDAADVALMFAGVLKDVGKTRLAQILIGGPTLSNFLDIAQRTVVLTVKGHAVMRDINRTLQGVEDGTLDKADAWTACTERAAMNRNLLLLLTGATRLGELDLIRAGGWIVATKEYGWIVATKEYDIIQAVADPIHGGISTETMAPTLSKDILAEGWRDGTALSSTSFFGVAPVDKSLYLAEGWLDEKQWVLDPHTDGKPVSMVASSLPLAEGWRDEKRVPVKSGGEHDGVAEYPFEWVAAAYGTQSEIGGTDYAETFPDGWVDGLPPGGTGPYVAYGGGGGTGPYVARGWEDIRGGSDEITYTEFVAVDPKDGDVTFDGWDTVRGGEDEFVVGWPIDSGVNAGNGSLRAELDFIDKGDALVDGGSILAGRPIG